MYKALTLQLGLLLWGAILSAQIIPVNVVGTVNDEMGGVEGLEVFITAFFADSSIYLNTVMTDSDGTFSDTFDSPDGQTSGVVMASIIDCDGDILEQFVSWDANSAVTLTFNFNYCQVTGSGDSCGVFIIQEGVAGSNVVFLYAIPIQGNAVTYLWSTGDSTDAIVPTQEGTYCVTITTANGCTATDCYDYVMDSTNCFVMINPSPNWPPALYAEAYGVPPFTFIWGTGETTQQIAPSDPGTYCVTMTDATGCMGSSCFVIDSAVCDVFITCDPAGSLTAQAASGNPLNIFYTWSTGETSQTITPAGEGLYCVTINDNSGCIDSACFYYAPFNQCGVILSYSPADSSSDEYIVVATPFGIAPFDYLWSTGDSTDVITVDSLSGGLCVTVTDASGCQAAQCLDSLFNSCAAWISVEYANSGAELTAFGAGTASGDNAHYIWSNGEATQSIFVTEPGDHCVILVTANGCTSTACVFVDFNGGGDSCDVFVDYVITADSQGVVVVNTIVVGGTPPYAYLWSTGEMTASIVLSDPNLVACVTVTDANGCTASTCIYPDPAQCYVTISADLVDTSTWVLTASGTNNANYQFTWSNGETSPVITVIQEGTYCVTVYGGVAGTMDSCYAEACIVINSFTDTSSGGGVIAGLVYGFPNVFVGGTVELYQVTSPNDGNNAWLLVDSTVMQQQGSYYIFEGVQPGLYAVKAIPENNPGATIEYLPTYHYSTVQWESADLVAMPNTLNVTTDVYLVATDSTNGTGIISGSISDDDGLLPKPIEQMRSGGIPGVAILLHTADGTVMGFTHSDVAGNFTFAGLPFGQYVITFDVPGISSPELWVTIEPDQPAAEGLVLSTSKLSSSTEDIMATSFDIYPVPATDRLTIQRFESDQSVVHLELMTIDGKMMARYDDVFHKEDKKVLPVGHLQSGLYLLRLTSEQGQTVRKWIKQ